MTDVTNGNTKPVMPTLTLKVDAVTAARLGRAAAELRTSKSAIIREALEYRLSQSAREPTAYDLMRGSIGAVDSGIEDLGHNPRHLEGFGRK